MSFSLLPPGRRLLLPILALGLLAVPARAQLGVNLEIKRHNFIVGEPVLATVTIVNMSGRDIMLADTQEGGQWFSFRLVSSGNRTVPARNPNYELQPLAMKVGETVRRSVNLTELYELTDFGTYRATASIYLPTSARIFSSRTDVFEITEGRLVWKQTVGVPNAPESLHVSRTFSLLTLEQDRGRMLYARVAGENDGTIYGCYNLGRIVDGFPPDVQFDKGNNLAVLHTTSRHEHLFSRIGVQGNFISQQPYSSLKATPRLRKLADGTLQLVGGVKQDTVVAKADAADAPKLSDRPPGFPKEPKKD